VVEDIWEKNRKKNMKNVPPKKWKPPGTAMYKRGKNFEDRGTHQKKEPCKRAEKNAARKIRLNTRLAK